jgi:hypothetical protein
MAGDSTSDVDAAIDTELAEFCRGEKDFGTYGEVRCLSVSPPYFRSHRPKGPKSGDSDINAHNEEEVREIGVSAGLVWSARMNTANLIVGLDPESQYIYDPNTSKWRYKLPSEYAIT